MRFKVLVLVFISLILVPSAFAKSSFRYINTDTFTVPLKEKLNLALETEFALNNKMRSFFYQHDEVGIEYAATPWLDLELDYREIFEKEGDKNTR